MSETDTEQWGVQKKTSSVMSDNRKRDVEKAEQKNREWLGQLWQGDRRTPLKGGFRAEWN